MADVLQDYFNRLTAVNRQRGMTGNMQYNKGLDASLAEGYFDAAQKNRIASQDLALRQKALEANTAYQTGSLDIARQTANTAALTSDWQKSAYNKALDTQNLWQGVGAGTALLTLGTGSYLKYKALPKTTTETPALDYNQRQNEYLQKLFSQGAIEGKDLTDTPDTGSRYYGQETPVYKWDFKEQSFTPAQHEQLYTPVESFKPLFDVGDDYQWNFPD